MLSCRFWVPKGLIGFRRLIEGNRDARLVEASPKPEAIPRGPLLALCGLVFFMRADSQAMAPLNTTCVLRLDGP